MVVQSVVHGAIRLNLLILAERGRLKPQAFRKPRFTREIAAIAFTIASFQYVHVKSREALRSPKSG
jgi:hypothetical protein